MNSQSSIKAPLSIWSFVFGFILIFSFFTQKLSLDIGFHLKAFMFFSAFTLFYISVTKVKVNFIFELHDLILLIFILYGGTTVIYAARSEEHTSELQSRPHIVCRLLLEKKKKKYTSCAISSKHSTSSNATQGQHKMSC